MTQPMEMRLQALPIEFRISSYVLKPVCYCFLIVNVGISDARAAVVTIGDTGNKDVG